MNTHKRKVLVIGIDGGTFDVISPLVNAGKLPNLGRLLQNGVHGELLSTVPPVTSPAWSSFITGTNPGSHGVFNFFERSLGNYEVDRVDTLMNLNNMQGIPFWRVLNKYGKKAGLINIPLTYPPDKVDGFMVSGMLVPDGANDYCYPPEIFSELDEYQVDLDGLWKDNEWKTIKMVRDDSRGYIQKVFHLTQVRAHNALALMQRKQWDFFMAVFTGSDRICHHFWTDPQTGESPSGMVNDYYCFLDDQIGRLFDGAGENTVKIVMSDHGFGKAAGKTLNAVALLPELGQPGIGLDEKSLFIANKLSRKLGLTKQKRAKPGENFWRKCRVFPWPMYSNFLGLCINTAGEKKWGTVAPGSEYTALREGLVEGLKNITDPLTGERVVKNIYLREDLYSGIYLENSPDIVVQFSYDYHVVFKPLNMSLIEKVIPERTGDHRREGIFIAEGPGIAAAKIGRPVGIPDVTATVLALLDVPAPASYEGNAVHELFGNQFREPARDNDLEELRLQTGTNQRDSREDFEKAKELLKSLGYMQ